LGVGIFGLDIARVYVQTNILSANILMPEKMLSVGSRKQRQAGR
jgi:hypothetical protein